jgi:hypothetical protein
VVKISPTGELTITTSSGTRSSPSSSESSTVYSVDPSNQELSAEDIALIRQTWEVAKNDRDIPIRTLIEYVFNSMELFH